MIPNINQNRLLRWLYQESLDAHNAETFSRNGESIDFDSGVFKGREEMAEEIIKIINSGCNFEEIDGKLVPITDEPDFLPKPVRRVNLKITSRNEGMSFI